MASSSFVPSVSETAELRANGLGVPILFPIESKGFAHVFSVHLCIRFSLQEGSIWVECEIYDPMTFLLSLTMRENSILFDNGSFVWELAVGKYRIYGVPQSRPQVSKEITTPPGVRVKIEPGIHTVIHLSDSSDGDEPVLSAHKVEPSSSSLCPPSVTPLF
jgi:hypothetical protein